MKRPISYKGKEITINDFMVIVPWDSLESVMGKRNTNAFKKWMEGQTSFYNGVYLSDLKAWLEHGINFD